MKLDAVPEGVLERVAVAAGLVPAPIVRVMWGVAIVRIVLPALKLGVFEAIGADSWKSAEEVAKAIGCDVEGTRVMLAALNGFDFLQRSDGKYALTSESQKWILGTSPKSVKAALEFAENLDEMMGGIENAVRTGKRGGLHDVPHSKEWWRRYMEGLGALSVHTGAEVARKVKLGNATPKKLLDVGGGHGGYAMAFCKKHPSLTATVLDLPEACEAGRAIVQRAGMSDRVVHLAGDLRHADWGEQHDVVLLFNILHNLPEAEARAAILKAHTVLAPGGTVVILDGEHTGKTGDLNSAEGFGELFFFTVSASSTWPESTLRDWLTHAGFTGTKRMGLLTFPSTILLSARK